MSTKPDTLQATQNKSFKPHFSLYHARLDGIGSAIQLENRSYKKDDPYAFLSLASQDKDSRSTKGFTFDWENSLGIKLGASDLFDIGYFIEAVFFNKSISPVKLYHSHPDKNANTILQLETNQKSGGGIVLSMSKKEDGGSAVKKSFGFMPSEIWGFKVVLTGITQRFFL